MSTNTIPNLNLSTKKPGQELSKLLETAKDPNSTSKDLRKVWDSTISPKVRKQVTLNPNADIEVMKMSARLYLKELLSNPSFELIDLFLDDPFVKAVQKAYKSPPANGGFDLRNINNERDRLTIIRAALLSPHLNYSTLETCSRRLPSSVFKRELKDPVVFNKVKQLVSKHLIPTHYKSNSPLEVQDLFKPSRDNMDDSSVAWAYRYAELGIVTKQEIDNIVYLRDLYRYQYHADPTQIRYIMSNLVQGHKDPLCLDSATRSILTAQGKSCLSKIEDLIIDSSKGPKYAKHKYEILESLSKVLTNCFSLYGEIGWENVGVMGHRFLSEFYKTIVNMVVLSVRGDIKKGEMDDFSPSELNSIYDLFIRIGFNDYSYMYYQTRFSLRGAKSYASLNSCSEEVQKFFIMNGFLSRGIPISNATDSLVSVIDKINNDGPIEESVFKYIDLKYYKHIHYDPGYMRYKLAISLCTGRYIPPTIDLKNNFCGYKTSHTPVKGTCDFVNRLLGRT